jgi:hypothetical protein
MQQYFNNKIKPLHVSANDVYHQEATKGLNEMFHVFTGMYTRIKICF